MHLPPYIGAEPFDLSIVIGNLLDNAIEASKKVKAEERSVCVEIRVDRRNLMMMVSNHYEEERKKSGNHYMTTKKADSRRICFSHAPEKIRTPDTTVRSRMLYPAELLTHAAACLSLTAQELLYPLWR